jgi:hypothetical protein
MLPLSEISEEFSERIAAIKVSLVYKTRDIISRGRIHCVEMSCRVSFIAVFNFILELSSVLLGVDIGVELI